MARSYPQGGLHLDACPRFHAIPDEGSGPATLVNEMTCPSCEVVIHDLAAGCETDDCREKARRYGVTSVPAVVVDGELAACCRGGGVDRDALRAAGVGVAR